jgi:hypothetical protein
MKIQPRELFVPVLTLVGLTLLLYGENPDFVACIAGHSRKEAAGIAATGR